MTARNGVAIGAPSVLSEEAERARVWGLAEKARKGTHAVFATRLLSIVSTLASITILARLVPPADFGIWAMAWLALGLMSTIREFGLASSIVQARSLTPQQQDGYFWLSVALSLATAGLLALATPLLARIYDAPLLRPVLLVGCVTLVLTGFGLVHAALLRRELQYNKLAVIEGGGMLCGLLTGLTAAYLWRDVWALVAAHVAQTLWLSATALLLYPWVPRAPRRTSAKLNLAFSFQLTLYNVLTYAGNNVGVAAGYRFGATDLGFFNRGRMLCQVAHYAFLTPITEVGLALLCRLKQDLSYRDAYIALARRVCVLFIPLAALVPILSEDLVLALLGPAWTPASPILAWFAPAIFGQALASLVAQLLTSQGRGRELRTWAAGDLVLRGAGAVAGSQLGIVGLAAGFSLATLLLSLPLILWIAGRSGPVKLVHQLVAMWPGVLLAAAAMLAAALALLGADGLGLGAGWGRLLFVGGAAALAWALLCLVIPSARNALLGKGMARE